jgi:hypothetical protein
MVIRRISIGTDYKSSMNFIHGQSVMGGKHKIHLIKEVIEGFEIWVENSKQEVTKWKEISKSTPHTIEYNIIDI